MKREELPPIAIFLCDESGIMAQPWAEAGVECYCVDMSHSVRRERVEGLIHYVWGDCRTWRPPEGRRIIFGAAFPPCTHVTGAGARDFVTKGGMMLRDALETFEACRTVLAWSGAPYLVENPVGVLSSIPHIGKPDHYFHPSQFTGFELTDNYTKLTALWVGNGFVMPEPFEAEGLGEPDDRIHKASPGADRATIRSKTPARIRSRRVPGEPPVCTGGSMMTRLLQDETQTHDSKGLSVWFASRADARRVAREAAAEITDAQIRDQDSLFGCVEEEKK